MLDPRHAYMSAYLKGEEPKVVASEHINKMLRASSLQDALAIIRETDVGNYLEELPVKTFDDLDEALWHYLAQCVSHVESFKFLPGNMRKVSRTYIVKYDVLNIKAALQSLSPTGSKKPLIPMGIIYNNGLLDELSDVENTGEIVDLLSQSRLGDYMSILEEYELTEEAKSKLVVESRLDGQYFKSILSMAKSVGDNSILSKAFGIVIDLTNLQIVSRAIIDDIGTDAAECVIPGGYMISDKLLKDLLTSKLADIPRKLEGGSYQDVAREILSSYDKTSSITAVGEVIDKYKFRLVKDILSPRVLSPSVMAWYLILKEVEIRNLRLILKAIIDGVSLEEITGYLVL